MKNIENWQESKFTIKNGVLKSSKDPKEVSLPSRIMANSIGAFYTEMLPQYAKGHLLDLGCGKVPLFGAYKDLVKDSFCVDWGNTIHKNSYLDLETDLNENLPLQSHNFDTIILSDVLEHIREPFKLWGEMNRVLKKDGYIIMNVPFYYWIHEEPYDYYRYTRFALEYMANKHGFEVVRYESLGGSPEIISDILSRYLIHLPILGSVLINTLQILTNFFISTSVGSRFSEKSSQKFPYGYGFVFKKQSNIN